MGWSLPPGYDEVDNEIVAPPFDAEHPEVGIELDFLVDRPTLVRLGAEDLRLHGVDMLLKDLQVVQTAEHTLDTLQCAHQGRRTGGAGVSVRACRGARAWSSCR